MSTRETTNPNAPDQAIDPVRWALRCAAQAVANESGDDIFGILVLGASRALGVDLSFIGVLPAPGTDRVRAIAVCDRGVAQPPFEYPLPGTPCEHVVGQQFRFHAEGIQTLFPDPHVREIGGIGYAAIPLFDSHGRAMGLMALIDRKPLVDRELTECILRIFSVRAAVELERRQATRALRQSEESYRSIFEAAEDALFVHDAATGAILDVNPKACEVYGYSRDEFRQLDLGSLGAGVLPYTLEHAGELIDRARREGPVCLEWQRRDNDGGLHWDEVYIKLVKIGGADRILAVTRDITERRRAEDDRVRLEGQLRQAQKMEAIGQLTGGIAHDFNNILTGAMGYLSMAREQAAQYADRKIDRYLDRAEQSSQRARGLIQQMLTFSRGQRGEPRSLQLAPHLAEAVRLMQSSLPSSVEIRTEFDDDVPCVLLDPLHVEQVLMNLCINARDAMRGKGLLTIRLRTSHCDGCMCTSCHQPVDGDFVELAVSDSGPGIDPQVLERMFEPFFSTKEVGSGSGMGLAMVHGIVHEYGGHILVEGGADSGATLRIWFPAWFPPAQPSTHTEPGSGDLAGTGAGSGKLQGRILLADDEPSVREFMQDLLGSWGLDVTAVTDGVEASEAFAVNPDAFDLVLLDQTMPQMTGLEAAEHLAKLRPDVPVLLYTGYSEQVSPAKLVAARVHSMVKKPLDIPAFRHLLENLLAATAGPGTPS